MRGRRLWLGILLGVTCWGCASEPPRFVYAVSGSAVCAYRIDPKNPRAPAGRRIAVPGRIRADLHRGDGNHGPLAS